MILEKYCLHFRLKCHDTFKYKCLGLSPKYHAKLWNECPKYMLIIVVSYFNLAETVRMLFWQRLVLFANRESVWFAIANGGPVWSAIANNGTVWFAIASVSEFLVLFCWTPTSILMQLVLYRVCFLLHTSLALVTAVRENPFRWSWAQHVFLQTKPCEIRRFVTLLRNYHAHRHVASVSGSCKGLRISLSFEFLKKVTIYFLGLIMNNFIPPRAQFFPWYGLIKRLWWW